MAGRTAGGARPDRGRADRAARWAGVRRSAVPDPMGFAGHGEPGRKPMRTLFRTRIKFCGMTRAGDVRLASELGVDAIGFVFAGDGPRRVHAQQARLMRNALAPLVDVVALFMENRVGEVREVVRAEGRR